MDVEMETDILNWKWKWSTPVGSLMEIAGIQVVENLMNQMDELAVVYVSVLLGKRGRGVCKLSANNLGVRKMSKNSYIVSF